MRRECQAGDEKKEGARQEEDDGKVAGGKTAGAND